MKAFTCRTPAAMSSLRFPVFVSRMGSWTTTWKRALWVRRTDIGCSGIPKRRAKLEGPGAV